MLLKFFLASSQRWAGVIYQLLHFREIYYRKVTSNRLCSHAGQSDTAPHTANFGVGALLLTATELTRTKEDTSVG